MAEDLPSEYDLIVLGTGNYRIFPALFLFLQHENCFSQASQSQLWQLQQLVLANLSFIWTQTTIMGAIGPPSNSKVSGKSLRVRGMSHHPR